VSEDAKELSKKLDKVITLLQDLIVMEACKADVKRRAVARALGIRQERVNRISTMWKSKGRGA
jgi:hypothetical protein